MPVLRKELGVLDIFCIASGAMISSGLFILPALAYKQTGPAVIFSYVLAGILVIPSMLAKAELATAMPKKEVWGLPQARWGESPPGSP